MAARGRILYLVELGETEAAVSWQVAEVSKAWQMPVMLLAVCRPRWIAALGREEQRGMRRELNAVARRLRALKAATSGVRVSAGDAVTEACRVADQIGARVVMIGAGAAAMAGQPPTAVAQDLASRARQDVWICRPDADPHLDHVLCAADTSALAGEALLRSVELCRRFNSRLRVLSVLPEPGRGELDPDDTARDGRRRQQEFLQRYDLRGVPLSRAIVWGAEAPVELLLEAERYGDGLLVLGASSNPGGRGLGATAQAVVRACPSSMLVVRSRVPVGPDPEEEAVGTAVATTEPADGDPGS